LKAFAVIRDGGYMNRITAWILAVAVASLSACGTVQVGQEFNLRTFQDRVERGITTQNQVRGWLGAPAGIGVEVDATGNRFEQWPYYRASGKMSDMSEAGLKILQVKFDKHGIVRAYSWSNNEK